MHSVWRPKIGHPRANKYTIRVNFGKHASDLVRVLSAATHSVAEVRNKRDQLVEKEILRLRTEWLAEGHQVPPLDHLGSLQRYRKKRAGDSKGTGTERKIAHEWKQILGKKGLAPRPRVPVARPKAQPKRRLRRNNPPVAAPKAKARPKQRPRRNAQPPAPQPKAQPKQRQRR